MRRILLDAQNIAWWRGAPPSLRLPLALMAALLEAGDEVLAVFDASARHQLAPERETYEALLRHPRHFVEVPSGRRADGELLRRARAGGGLIVSRDRYRDHRRRYRKLIDDPARLLAGHVHEDRVLVPLLGVAAELPATAGGAWQRLAPLLAGGDNRRLPDAEPRAA